MIFFMAISSCKKLQITALHLISLQLLLFLSSIILQLIEPNSSTVLPASIARRWKEINGERQWKGLLDPLDLDLRYNIVLYGEMTQAIYDTFIIDKKSKFAGAPQFSREHFLDSVTATLGQARLYEVTKYIYGTSSIPVPDSWLLKPLSRESWSKESNWIGFVAVATEAGKEALGRRDILVVWRGTVQTIEWAKDFDSTMVPATDIVPPGPSGRQAKVHRGFLSVYTSNDTRSPYNKDSARNQVLGEVRRLVQAHEQENVSITLTGHSLGSALSTLCAVDIVANGFNKPKGASRRGMAFPVAAFAFGSPKVGNTAFRDDFARTPGLRLLRIRNQMDPVAVYPLLGYAHAGVELLINFRRSPYLKTGSNVLHIWHNLECYLHGVAGTQGSKGEFKLSIDRDVALVNKGMNALRDEYMVPASWWSPKNKGMVQGANGHWTLQDHEEDSPY